MITKNNSLVVFFLTCFTAFGQSSLSASDFHSTQTNSKVKIIAICKPEDFKAGHIENAVNVWRPDYEDHEMQYGGMMATKDSMALWLGNLGISTNDSIVIYDHRGGCDAARLWWILDFYNHKNVQILDGGYEAWISKKFMVSTILQTIEPATFAFQGENDSTLFSTLKHLRAARKRGALILDVRTKDEYIGKITKDGAFRAGRIPDALFSPWTDAIESGGDKTLRSIKELKKMYNKVGLSKDEEIIVYCHSGARSSHTAFVLTKLLGYTNVKNYDGSWIEYSFYRDLPSHTGEVHEDPDPAEKNLAPLIMALFIALPIGLFAIFKIKPKSRRS